MLAFLVYLIFYATFLQSNLRRQGPIIIDISTIRTPVLPPPPPSFLTHWCSGYIDQCWCLSRLTPSLLPPPHSLDLGDRNNIYLVKSLPCEKDNIVLGLSSIAVSMVRSPGYDTVAPKGLPTVCRSDCNFWSLRSGSNSIKPCNLRPLTFKTSLYFKTVHYSDTIVMLSIYRIYPNRSTVRGCASINFNNKACHLVSTEHIYTLNLMWCVFCSRGVRVY